jgi:Flp pilus assembly protein TadG
MNHTDRAGAVSSRCQDPALGPARRSDRGSALVELAVCLPLLVLLMVGATDFARVFYTSIELNSASRAGAQYGASNLARSGSISGMQIAATSAVNITGVTAVATRTCQCADDAGTFSALAGGTTCATDVATSCPSKHRVVTVTVTASKTFTSFSNYGGLFSPVELSRTATLRVSE